MPEYRTEVTAEKAIKCSQKDAIAIVDALLAGSTDVDDYVDSTRDGVRTVHHYTSGINLEIDKTELYIFGMGSVTVEEAPAAFWIAVGKLLKKLKMPYLQFGMAYTCSKHCPGSFGGTNFRLYPDGEIEFPKEAWPR